MPKQSKNRNKRDLLAAACKAKAVKGATPVGACCVQGNDVDKSRKQPEPGIQQAI
ncbi:hypothetical protein DAEQUDRAFT_732496 [Daedalea quercina L-15889]|uniref:Uncharacterized protein n=1 Tax=Daedalea quercina L-15889 TaxID=1314783 RepID=A0A165LL04_9APHY|nr:hypothetical protein DAEQUDRAFT_732496 [Daedalea quercina L-15889]